MIVRTTAADAIVHVPRGTDVLAPGARVALPAALAIGRLPLRGPRRPSHCR